MNSGKGIREILWGGFIMRGTYKWPCLISLFAFLAFAALSGCSAATLPTDSDRNRTVQEPRMADGIDISSNVKISGYLLGSPLPGMPAVLSALNDKLRKDLNAELEINYINWGDVQSKYPLILAAGEDVDWVFTAQWAFYSQLAAKGAFLEITPELLAKYMPRHYELIRSTTALDESKINGKIYMIPTSTPDRKSSVFIYREDLRKKYGVPEIKKFSDLEPYLKAIKENEPGMIPLQIGSSYDLQTPHLNLVSEQYDMVLDILPTSSGGTGIVCCPLDRDGKLYYLYDEPIASAYREAAYIIKSWYEKGYINKGAFANKVRSKEAFVQGKSAVGLGNSVDIQGNIAMAAEEGFDVGLVQIVSGKSGSIVADSYIGNGIAVARNSKHVERTMMAMDLIMEDREYDMLVYFGIEGKNYEIKDDKIVLLNSSDKDKDSYPPDQSGFWFTNKDIFPPLESWTPSYIAHREQIKSLLAPNIYAAFAPATDNIKVEAETCNQIITQYLNPIQLGSVKDVDASFKALEEKLKSAGIERIMAEMKKQTQAFLEKQKK
jgi:putative aldouronate transport system substrate-binding protein